MGSEDNRNKRKNPKIKCRKFGLTPKKNNNNEESNANESDEWQIIAPKKQKKKAKKSTKAPTGVTEQNKPVIDLEKEEECKNLRKTTTGK